MRSAGILLCLGLLLLAAGCFAVPSLHPLYTQEDLIFDESLIGTWVGGGEENPGRWVFEKGENKAYKLTTINEDGTSKFEAHLVKLGEHTFLDTLPEPLEGVNKDFFYGSHYIPAHCFSKIAIKGDSLQIALLDPDWLKEKMEKGEVSIAHEQIDDGDEEAGISEEKVKVIVLTASTKEIQRFVSQYAEDREAFPAALDLQRKK